MGWMVKATPWLIYRRGMTRYPLCRRLGGTQGQSGRVRNISPLPGFDPRIVQPVASRYTDCADPDHNVISVRTINEQVNVLVVKLLGKEATWNEV
jgi:hypothetical protein